MLALESLSVRRGHTEVLRSIDLHVEKGEIVALVGANGAGKTTLLMTISGLLRPHEGRLVFDAGTRAVDLTRCRAEAIVAQGIAHCPEGRQVFASLSVRENLAIGAYLRRDAPTGSP